MPRYKLRKATDQDNEAINHPPEISRYTLLDMAVWGWARAVPFALGSDAWEQLPHVKRLLDAVNERPAAQRTALLKDKHDFKTEMDDEARRAMFPHLAPAQG